MAFSNDRTDEPKANIAVARKRQLPFGPCVRKTRANDDNLPEFNWATSHEIGQSTDDGVCLQSYPGQSTSYLFAASTAAR